MRAAVLGEHVACKVIAPAQQCHFEFEPRAGARRREHHVIRAAVLETVSRDDGKFIADVAEPEARGVECMRAEIVENAGALIAPVGISHEPRRAVAVEHAATIDAAELPRRDEIAHAHEMRFKAMIVGGVKNHALLTCILLEPHQGGFVLGDERLLDERMLAVFNEVVEQFDFRGVGHAKQRSVEVVERNLA